MLRQLNGEVVKAPIYIRVYITYGNGGISPGKRSMNHVSYARQMGDPTIFNKFRFVPLIHSPSDTFGAISPSPGNVVPSF